MARTTGKRVGLFNFTNWPEKAARPSFTEHSALVVDEFVRSLDPSSTARVVGLEVESGSITLVRRKRKLRVDEKFAVSFDLYGSTTREKAVAKACSDPLCREYLREMVEAASGNAAFNTSRRSLIAGMVFTTSIGI